MHRCKIERPTQSLHVKLASDSKLPAGQSKKGNWGVHKGSFGPAGSSGPCCPGGEPRAPAPGGMPFREKALKLEGAPEKVTGTGTGCLLGPLGLSDSKCFCAGCWSLSSPGRGGTSDRWKGTDHSTAGPGQPVGCALAPEAILAGAGSPTGPFWPSWVGRWLLLCVAVSGLGFIPSSSTP